MPSDFSWKDFNTTQFISDATQFLSNVDYNGVMESASDNVKNVAREAFKEVSGQNNMTAPAFALIAGTMLSCEGPKKWKFLTLSVAGIGAYQLTTDPADIPKRIFAFGVGFALGAVQRIASHYCYPKQKVD